MLNSDVVDVEVASHIRQTVDASLSNESAEKVSIVGDFRGDCGFNGFSNLIQVSIVLNLVGNEAVFVDQRKGFLGSFFVAIEDLAGVKTHSNQVFSMTEQFSSQSDGKVSGISALFFLHLACQHQHLGCWVLHFKLNVMKTTSLRIVAASEVTKVLSM